MSRYIQGFTRLSKPGTPEFQLRGDYFINGIYPDGGRNALYWQIADFIEGGYVTESGVVVVENVLKFHELRQAQEYVLDVLEKEEG